MTQFNNMTQSERLDFWSGHVANWQKSGQTKKDYCNAHNIRRQTFSGWVKRLCEPSQVPALVELPTSDFSEEPESPSISLIVYKSIRISLPDTFDPATLRRLLSTLGIDLCS